MSHGEIYRFIYRWPVRREKLHRYLPRAKVTRGRRRFKRRRGPIPTFFRDPHSPWQHGSIENATGILRRDLPRKTELADDTEQDIQDIVWANNTTPRKRPGFLTPAEAFLHQLRCCT